jgi:hypothetical protein
VVILGKILGNFLNLLKGLKRMKKIKNRGVLPRNPTPAQRKKFKEDSTEIRARGDVQSRRKDTVRKKKKK